MHTETYRRLYSRRGQAHDEHYRCLRSWLEKRRDATAAEKCLTYCRKYQKALEAEYAYLKTRPQTGDVIRRIDDIRQLLDILTGDLKMLTEH